MVGASCKAYGGPPSSENRAHRPGGDGESSPGGVRSLLPGPMGGQYLRGTGRTGPGGTGSPAQGVFGVSCKANGGPISSENRAHQPGGDGESSPGGVRSLLPGLRGAIFFSEPGTPARGGRGFLPTGCSEPPARANGGPSSSENRAHQPWGGRGVQPRGCSEPPARPMGGQYLRRTGRTGLGGTGSPAQGVFGGSCQAYGGPSSSQNRAHRPEGDGESSPGGVRSLLQGQWGAIFFREPGAPARGGRGVLPRGCSKSPARPMGGHLLQRTGRTGLGGTGSPAQGVFGASCQASGRPVSSENRAHRPGGDRESCPGGVGSLLPGQWGAIFFREPGAPAWGGRGVLPRGCSESPARPVGGHLLQRTGRTGPGGMGSPAQGVFGVSCQANGGPSSSENRAHRPWGGRGVLPRGCSESPARPMGDHLLQRTGRTGPGGTGSPAQGVFGASCQGQWGAIFFREPGAPAWGGRGVLPRGCSESPARPVGGHLLQRTGRTGPGGTGSPAQGMFGVSCQGQWGAIFFREPGAPARGGRGVLPRGCSESPARPTGGHLLQRTGRTGLGGTGSPAQGVFGVSCQAYGGPSSSENRAHRPGGDGESCPGGVRSLLQGQWGAIFFREPGAPARGGWGVLPRGCSESPARPMGGHLLQRTGRTGPGGDGESCPGGVRSLLPGQWGTIFFREPGAPARGGRGVLPRGCSEPPARANGGPSSSENRAHRPGGDGESCPRGVRSLLQGQWGAIFFREPGAPARGGRGVLPRGCSESPARANGGPSSSENRAHRPGGDGESCPGGVRSLLPGQRGAIFFREPGAPAWGGRGVLPRGCSESPARPMGGHLLQRTGRTSLGGTGSPAQGVFGTSCQANGGPISSENRAHRPGGDGESCPGGVLSLVPGLRGAIFFREPGAPAWGGRGVQPRGCPDPPARPMGGQYLRRTGRTGLGGTGSPAQGVFGASCQANGGPISSENRAHRPGGDGESSPGGVRSLLQGQWGAIFFREPGAPARGGRGVLPRGCSESPARPMGGHLLQRTGRTGPGGTGSPAQGVFGASCQASGGPVSSENRAHRPGGDRESCPGGVRSLLPGQWGAIFFREPGAPAWGGRGVLPRGCSESLARPVGGHLLQRTGRTGPGGDGESCPGGVRSLPPGQWGAIFFREPGAPAWGGRGVLPRGCSESPARPRGGHLLQRTGRTGPGGDGESCPGGVRNLLPGQWGAIFFREPGAPARGGRGVLPRGCSESPARANGGPSSSEDRAHRPGGDGESCPGGVRSLLQGQWGAIFFREPGAPARGGQGVLPRGC